MVMNANIIFALLNVLTMGIGIKIVCSKNLCFCGQVGDLFPKSVIFKYFAGIRGRKSRFTVNPYPAHSNLGISGKIGNTFHKMHFRYCSKINYLDDKDF